MSILNENIGVLGHVDSGKTSLGIENCWSTIYFCVTFFFFFWHTHNVLSTTAKRLSEIASTACFDKAPQSQQRGMTLDLGFSAFFAAIPDHWKGMMYCLCADGALFRSPRRSNFRNVDSKHEKLQFTLVDCPGHASLIRTILGGAQIINTMLLVIDATRGIQTQTAECLVIGEMTAKHLVVVLNKIDLLAAPIEKSIESVSLCLKTMTTKCCFFSAKF